MFDDPNRELKRLQNELLAAEQPQQEPEYAGHFEKSEQPPLPPLPEPKKPSRREIRSRIAGMLIFFVLISVVLSLLLIWWWLWR